MNRFRIRAEKGQQGRTWLVVAGNLFEAISLIPEDFAVRAVEVKVDAIAGPSRTIGWMDDQTVQRQADRRLSADAASLAAMTIGERLGL